MLLNESDTFKVYYWMIKQCKTLKINPIIYAWIHNCINKGKQIPSIQDICTSFKVSKPTAIKILKIFKKEKTPEEIKNYIISNIGEYICDWCKCNTHVIQSHHYPIQRKDGGNKLVSICPNCHSAYHSLKR